MTLEECYQSMEGNFEEIKRRLGRESLIQRLLLMMPRDTNYELLCSSLENKDYESAFRAAHSLKGVTLNLGLTKLAGSVSELTEILRGGTPSQDPEPLLARVKADYAQTVEAIAKLAAETAQGM